MTPKTAELPEGSSPLTRGKHFCSANDVLDLGLIPAHAGKTHTAQGRVQEVEAHPRSRGENIESRTVTAPCAGSSPLTRGKRRRRRRRRCCGGLIPAHAGKTFSSPASELIDGAHPRSRGENTAAAAPMAGPNGSSPLTRGKRAQIKAAVSVVGLIPAHAGKTRMRTSSISPSRAHPRSRGENHHTEGAHDVRRLAHPRSRGENAASAWARRPWAGSSPLTRGKPARAAAIGPLLGLIPAHAGKTDGRLVGRVVQGAHPRSRGENQDLEVVLVHGEGSSPLTRGKHDEVGNALEDGRLIPAHAGKTLSATSSQCVDWAHPRSRGENQSMRGYPEEGQGSSPLTRGKQAVEQDGAGGAGLIPAHAGKTGGRVRRLCD